jgi:hypothetical protein
MAVGTNEVLLPCVAIVEPGAVVKELGAIVEKLRGVCANCGPCHSCQYQLIEKAPIGKKRARKW